MSDFLEDLKKMDRSTQAKLIYYASKLELPCSEPIFTKALKDVVLEYMHGLQFVLTYYYRGAPSWEWFYSYHYAPLVCDIFSYLSLCTEDPSLKI